MEPQASSPGNPPVILHVEDDPNDAFLLKSALGRIAPETRLLLVTDGREAQEYLGGKGRYADRTRHPLPDLVILDLKLPRFTGLEVLEWMKTRQELLSLPVHILSSSSEKRDVDLAQSLGATGYHSKQGSLKALSGILETILASAKAVPGSKPPA